MPDKKSFYPVYDAKQSVQNRKPRALDDLNFSYLHFREKQCLTVDYNLNDKNNLNIFVVFRILDVPGGTINGIFGNDNSKHVSSRYDRFIDLAKISAIKKVLRIGYGGGYEQISSFPDKASPVTLDCSLLSVHYNTVQVDDSLIYCNGKYIANFTSQSNTGGQNTFSIGSISSDSSRYDSEKHIPYFSLHHGRFSVKYILIMHKYLCERYRIDHHPITIPQ